ncbi:hypothetical protein Tco_0697876 [Tanacetum coccineum]
MLVYEYRLRWNEAATPSSKPEIRQLAIKNEYGFVIHLDFGALTSDFPVNRSSNTDVLDSPCLLVLITGNFLKADNNFSTSLIHVESCKSPTKSLFDVGSSRISIFTVNIKCTADYWQDSRIMRRTLCTGMLDWNAREGNGLPSNKDTYSASAEDIEVQSCFLDDQLTNLSPPRNSAMASLDVLWISNDFVKLDDLLSKRLCLKDGVDRKYACLTINNDETIDNW